MHPPCADISLFHFFSNLIVGVWRRETVSFAFVSLALSIASGMVGVYILYEGMNEQNLFLTPFFSFVFRVKIGRSEFSLKLWKMQRK